MVPEIDARELAKRLANEQSLLLLDIRQPWEHQLAAIPGSVLIPLPELPARASEIENNPERAIIVYCHHGMRSQSGGAYLLRIGHGNVFSLAGGIDAWSCVVDPAVPRY